MKAKVNLHFYAKSTKANAKGQIPLSPQTVSKMYLKPFKMKILEGFLFFLAY